MQKIYDLLMVLEMAPKSKRRLVMKIGGKSLSSGELIKNAAEIIARESVANEIIVVVSAPGNTTSSLVGMLEGVGNPAGGQGWDRVLSYGEMISASLLAVGLNNLGVRFILIEPSSEMWPVITDDRFGNANPLEENVGEICKERIEPLLKEGFVLIVPGFIGKTTEGRISTMGRGSSDLTAFLLAKHTLADEVIKISDVDGIYIDGRIVPEISAGKLREICSNGGPGYERPNSIIQLKALDYFRAPLIARVVSYREKEMCKGGTVIRPDEAQAARIIYRKGRKTRAGGDVTLISEK